MAKRWMAGVWITLCVLAGTARAQYSGPHPLTEPMPCAPSTMCPTPAVQGPISPQMAPPGPSECLALPSNTPGAFDDPDDCGCCKHETGGCGYWASAEYVHWKVKNSHVPPLLTVGSTRDNLEGAIGQPTTATVFPNLGGPGVPDSNGNVDTGWQPGGRFTAGVWLNDIETLGVEANYFFLQNHKFVQRLPLTGGTSDTDHAFVRPFFDIVDQIENVEVVSDTNRKGTFEDDFATNLWGTEVDVLANVSSDCWYRIDFIIGARYAQLKESLQLSKYSQTQRGATVLQDENIVREDLFQTQNRFYGGQVGFRTEVRFCRLFANVTGKVALGETEQTVQIDGGSAILLPGQFTPPGNADPALLPFAGVPAFLPGGLFAQTTNIGRYIRHRFAVASELDVNVGYTVCSWLRMWVGYTLFDISAVVRPGDQLNRVINPTFIPFRDFITPFGPSAPTFAFHQTDFWAQGVSLGIEVRY